ncbi:GreA/GreB family elongation factor [Gilvimarinus polysaccharolyticus]|uniref:GreA/GreB family elongation factor n=1 Tax=Gilvimarinus polysaccharolyticus TaxID=863921 RepID=UPI0006730D99|nr:GreA/GreB family elongation factor [Gilvimarinus polysaccharolyticus]
MCSVQQVESKRSVLRRAQSYYLTRPWGLGIEPLMLSKIFERIELHNGDISQKYNRVSINSSVTLMDYQENQLVKLQIVSPALSNPEAGLVSYLSPLGAQLIDTKKGDVVNVDFLGAHMQFQVVEVH